MALVIGQHFLHKTPEREPVAKEKDKAAGRGG
jgi:hypothetical protein